MVIPRAQSFLKRLFSSSLSTKNALQHLKERSLIQIKGPDSSEFLQGLITNDIQHLSSGVGSMFTMFLNTKGRILYDALIYKTEENNVYFIECDYDVSSALQKHLKIYKVKRKVDISGLDSHKIYALYNLNILGQTVTTRNVSVLDGEYEKSAFPESSTNLKIHKDLYIFKDPRVTQLGFRIITETDNIQNCLKDVVHYEVSNSYKKLRYSLGVGEGTEELPSGNSNPLECNGDYLHGVSFHKGCYIGQELTARTYHTGAIRKRLMPLYFIKVPKSLPENVILHNNVNLGKLRGIEGDVGLALLRIKQALDFKTITVGDGEARIVKPEWWPIELPKEKLNVQTTT